MKILVILSIAAGSLIFAGFPTLSAKLMKPTLYDTFIFNLWFLPCGFVANMLLGWGYIQGNIVFKSIPFVSLLQTSIFVTLMMVLSYLILHQKLNLTGLIGVCIMITGIIIINKSLG